MATDSLHVLNGEGDVTLTWDPANPTQVAAARQEVERLRSQGYSFFLVDGSPAPNEVTAGQGTLSCRRIEAEAVVQAAAPVPTPQPPPAAPESESVPVLPLPQRAKLALRDAAITTVEQLAAQTRDQLLALAGIGVRTLEEIEQVLAARNLTLATEAGPAEPGRRVVATRALQGG